MNKSGYDQLLQDDNDNDSLSPFIDSEPNSSNYKTVTSQPFSSSLPAESFFQKTSSGISDSDLESQPLLPKRSSYNDVFNNKIRRTTSTASKSIISLDLKSFNNKVSKWTSSLWTSNSKLYNSLIEIQYSVFKPLSSFKTIERLPSGGFINLGPVTQFEFNEIVEDSIKSISELDIKPKRIKAGSSGSYFIYNSRNEIVGVFKPKDEEPYGPLSPKWTKWFHRNLFPCFFGRSCLIPNLGYICESAASLLDCQLNTYIVPLTNVVSISSDSFYYSYWDRKSKSKLPPKIGSFQLFLNGYIEADKFFEKYPLPGSKWCLPGLYYTYHELSAPSPVNLASTISNDEEIDLDIDPEFKWTNEVIQQFREQLEKLVILDYIMRNTDRGLDNWMIKIEWEVKSNGVKKPILKIGAIDSGLSFPWKHPDEWRSYPFGWLFLPVSIIGQPFSENTRNHFLPLLTSVKWWEESSTLFKDLFSKDSDFKERMWKKQWSVLKGQAFNVVETLKNPTHGPLELVRRTRMLVRDQEMEVPTTIPISMMQNAMNTPLKKPRNNYNSMNSLEIIDEDPINKNIESDDDELQKNWNHLLNGEINEIEFQSPIKSPQLNSIDQEINHSNTKTVIIERIQAVTSKPPLFTCC